MDLLDTISENEWQEEWHLKKIATVAHLTMKTDKIILTMMLKKFLENLGRETMETLSLEMQELLGRIILGILCHEEGRLEGSTLLGVWSNRSGWRHLRLQYWNRNYTFNSVNISLNYIIKN